MGKTYIFQPCPCSLSGSSPSSPCPPPSLPVPQVALLDASRGCLCSYCWTENVITPKTTASNLTCQRTGHAKQQHAEATCPGFTWIKSQWEKVGFWQWLESFGGPSSYYLQRQTVLLFRSSHWKCSVTSTFEFGSGNVQNNLLGWPQSFNWRMIM